jgi:hypothetical protein
VLFCDGYALCIIFLCFVRYSREKVFRKIKSGQLQRKVEKFGQTAKIIIFVSIQERHTYLINSFFFVRYARGWKKLKVFNRKKNLEDLEKNLEKLN